MVKRGEKIGYIGLSGSTQFPHVHVSLRRDRQPVDLLTATHPGQKCTGEINTQILTKSATLELANMQKPLLMAGFAAAPVTGIELMKGEIKKPAAGTPLVLYAQFMNLKRGDRVRLEITGPNEVSAENESKPLDRSKATYTAYTGIKSGGKKGQSYIGRAWLIRDNKTIFTAKPVFISF